MVLEAIYIVRHGLRSDWTVDASTGTYTARWPSPTKIPNDPALVSGGEKQSYELAEKLVTVDPPIDVVYSSPFYRCLQTIRPTVKKINGQRDNEKKIEVRVENGLGEWLGRAPFAHPPPLSAERLRAEHYPFLSPHENTPIIIPHHQGESVPSLHARIAYTLHHLINTLDSSPSAPRAVLIATHAASMIVMGRVLTGRMPDDPNEEDFRCGTCALSVFRRWKPASPTKQEKSLNDAAGDQLWDPAKPKSIPRVEWVGKGVGGGWACEANGDSSFLSAGEQRSWRFAGDETFAGFELDEGETDENAHAEFKGARL